MKYDQDSIDAKKELIYRDFESLFSVYERETNIIFNFRNWTITLLSGYFGVLVIQPDLLTQLAAFALPVFIIVSFALLEIAERSVMVSLLKEVRKIEKIFMEENSNKLAEKINQYEFRDLRDKKMKLKTKIKYLKKASLTPQVLSWYPFIAIASTAMVLLIK